MVLTIVITTSLAVFVERTRRLRQASDTILAYQLLANEAEMQRRIAFKDLSSGTLFESDTALIAPLAPYVTKIDVTPKRTTMKTVTLSIRWNGGQREARLTIMRVNTGGGDLW
jgi:hypothetical protein